MYHLADILARLCLVSVAATANAYESPTARRAYYAEKSAPASLVCLEVAERALDADLDPLELIALSWVETRHTREVISSAKARGPLQILRKYWRRTHDHDDIAGGLRAWSYYRARSSSAQEAAGRYNGGGSSSGYAIAYQAHLDKLRRAADIFTAHRGGAR